MAQGAAAVTPVVVPPVPANTRAASIAGAFTFLAGAFYVVCTCLYLGWRGGLLLSAQDPGKIFFHLILFPIAAATLTYRFPFELVRTATKQKRLLSLLILFLGLVVMCAITWDDSVRRFKDYPAPADVADKSIRGKLLTIQTDLWNTLPSSLAAAPTTEARRKVAADAHNTYLSAANQLPNRSLRQASFRYYWGIFLTALAGVVLVALLWALLLFVVLRQQPASGFAEVIVMVICLLAPWLLLRTYSEWYLRFGDYQPSADQPLIIVGVFGAVVIYFAWLLQHGRPKIKVFAGGFAVISSALGVIGKWKSAWLVAVAQRVAGMDSVTLAAAYFLVALVTVGTVWYAFSPASAGETNKT